MTELLTAAQMKSVEQSAIESGEVTGLDLMERAGQGVVDAIFEKWPELARPELTASRSSLGQVKNGGRCAMVLCGPGNNGGDGFVVARLLKALGWQIEVHLYGNPEKLPPDARVNFERWSEQGQVRVHAIDPLPVEDDYLRLPDQIDLIIDGAFGTGLTRRFGGVFAMLAVDSARELLREKGVRVVAIDTPSGLCADSGCVIGNVIAADLTVTFHSKKIGHVIADGPANCGDVRVKSIGLKHHESDRVVHSVVSNSASIEKSTFAHKYTHGHALILSGGSGKTGAARLAARGGLRIGAGLVTLGVPLTARTEVAAQVTSIMLQRVEGSDDLSEVLQDERFNALCLGPGLGIERAGDLVPVALAAKRATVLDADALTAFADDPPSLFQQLHDKCVLTPHGGEFSRLFPDISEKLAATPTKGPAYSKVDATRDASERAGCVVLFKGPDTVIAAPNGQCMISAAVYKQAAPWLATAGAGDVLAGYLTGLMARRFTPMQASGTAAWLHAECARAFGPGLIAEDLPEQLPKIFKHMNM